MSCCFGSNTIGKEPQKSISDQSDPPSNRPIIPVNKPVNPKIEYSITVKTGDFRNSGTNGPVYINIFGRNGIQTEDLLLSASNKPFTQNSTQKFQINATDIGKPQSIIVRHEDESTGWYVDYVEISVHNFLVRFVANRWLNKLKHDQKLFMELFGSEQPAVIYNIEVQTGDEQTEPLDSPVYIQIYGTTTTTPKLFLESKTASFTKGSTSKFSLSSNNVGEIQRVIIGHEGLGKMNNWYLKSVQVQMLGQQQEYLVEKWLSPNLGDQKLFVELSKEEPPTVDLVRSLYTISIRTADVAQNQTPDNVEMSIQGSDKQIGKILLKDHAKENQQTFFQRGNHDQFEIEHENIGKIESITIGFNETEQPMAWLLEQVDIKCGETIDHFRGECWLSNRLGPEFSWTTIKTTANHAGIHYKILVHTGQSGIHANVILCIYGDEETTANLPLKTTKDGSQAAFEKESSLEFDVEALDVGKIKKINIGHDGKGNENQWFLKTIQIDKDGEHYTFTANRWLSEEKDDRKTFVDLSSDQQTTPVLKKDQAIYTIIIVTSSDDHAGTDSGVLMTIFGDKDATKQFQVVNTELDGPAEFETGTTNEFEMELDDVGTINKINIGQDGKGSHPSWHLKSVQIQKGSKTYNFHADKTLDKSDAFVNLTPTAPAKAPTPELIEPKKAAPDELGKAKTPSPELIRPETPTPEPAKLKAPTPELAKTKTVTPDPTKEKAATPEPAKSKAPTPELVKAKTTTPDPMKEKTATPEPAKSKAPTPELAIAKSTTPEPTKTKTPTPEPAKTKTPTPELTKAKTQAPEPVKKEAPRAATPERKSQPAKETTYKVLIQSEPNEKKNLHGYLIIHGQHNHTSKLLMNDLTASNPKNECQLKAVDVGKVSKIVLGQENPNDEISWYVENVTIKRNTETTTFNVERTIKPNSKIDLTPSTIPKKTEATYKTLVQTGASQEEGDHSNLTMTIVGKNGQTKALPLDETTKTNKTTSFNKDEKIEFELKTHDVGKISKITLHQNSAKQGVRWHINNITIKRSYETTTFNIEHQLDPNSEHTFTPSPIVKKTETPRKGMKPSDTISKTAVKAKDADYEIIISTGDQAFDAPVVLKIRGESGIVSIPLNKSKSGEKPFRSKATDEFTCRTNDVGKIKRITFEHEGNDDKLVWHIRSVQIKKDNETHNFIADVHLDYKENRVNLYPVGAFLGHQKEDYVQSELRRLRESLRMESAKLRPPTHKLHEPFVFNDLSPYFDTSPVERAIYSPNNAPPGYYNRITALRIVEPWEAYGMDYGVSYEFLKQRKSRSLSSKRPPTKNGEEVIDRKQGSTHLPKFPSVSMRKPKEYSRPLTMNDVPRIRSLVQTRYTAEAHTQRDKDYQRTRDDFYRMELDNLEGYHESNRENMLRTYHSYLENTPGSKKALRELCARVPLNASKPSINTNA